MRIIKEVSNNIFLRTVMNTVLDVLIIIDADNIIQDFNLAAEDIFGYNSKEVIGKNIKILVPPPNHSEHDNYLFNYLKEKNTNIIDLSKEVLAKRKNNSIFPTILKINRANIDNHFFFVITIRDLTDQKKIKTESSSYIDSINDQKNRLDDQEVFLNTQQDVIDDQKITLIDQQKLLNDQQKFLQIVLENIAEGILTIDNTSTIKNFNKTCQIIFDYSFEEAIKQNIKILIPELYKNNDGNYEIKDKKETKKISKKGTIIPITLSISEVKINNQDICIIIVRNITEQKKAEEKIQKSISLLKQSNQDLDDFAYIASHDLKEPLRGLSNNDIFLKEDCEDRLDENDKKKLDRITFLCKRMENLVDNLLYFSRLGRQKLAIKATNINLIIDDIKMMMATTLAEKNADIIIPIELPKNIVCDAIRITEVFRNLITNAVKYNNSDIKKIEFGMNSANQLKHKKIKKSDYIFYVKEVFRIFKRLNAENDNTVGTRVGLTFVKKIIERHKGIIWIEPNKPQGTIFFFSIPKLGES